MKIIDCIRLKERKNLRKKQSERKEEDKGEERERKQKETNRGVTAFSELARPFTNAYVHHCGLLVRAHPALPHPALAHPASSAAINVRFPTVI